MSKLLSIIFLNKGAKMNTIIKILLILSFSALALMGSDNIKNSIVKIHVGKIYNSEEERLYTKGEIVYLEGTGLIVNKNRILTSANLVKNCKWLTINKKNNKKWYKVKVKKISFQTNLALLEFQDFEIYKDFKPIPYAKNIKKKVSIYGFEAGDNEVSIKYTSISRIKKTDKTAYKIKFPVIQVDEDLNHLISGAIVVNLQNRLIGIGMQPSEYFSNKAFIVPLNVIRVFLNDENSNRKKEYFFNSTQLYTLLEKGNKK